MVLTSIQCPICKANFSVSIDTKTKECSAKKCPKCGVEIEMK